MTEIVNIHVGNMTYYLEARTYYRHNFASKVNRTLEQFPSPLRFLLRNKIFLLRNKMRSAESKKIVYVSSESLCTKLMGGNPIATAQNDYWPILAAMNDVISDNFDTGALRFLLHDRFNKFNKR